jgi:hypothetical protein
MKKSEQQNQNISTNNEELIFSSENNFHPDPDQSCIQSNLDIALPGLIIIVGVLQFVIRKWLFPVSEDVIDKLENQIPTQGLIYRPELGIFIALIGLILLLVFNLNSLFS